MEWITLSSLTTLYIIVISIFSTEADCTFPLEWTGSWFQNGIREPVVITRRSLTIKGRVEGNCSKSNNRDKYLVPDRKKNCYKCLAITEKHSNVLQYKMSQCHARGSLGQTCALITGDAPLFTMFRIGGEGVECPFSGPFQFSYDSGMGSCHEPMSTVDTCTDKSKLRLTYQACADVLNSEHRNVLLECIATWKEGSRKYLVGRFTHKTYHSDEESYRCFMYDKTTDGYTVTQSADATCKGLFSSTDGPVTMKLKSESYPASKCSFPFWMTKYKQWRSLQGHQKYVIMHNNAMEKLTYRNEVLHSDRCIYSQTLENFTQITTFTINGCRNAYQCYRIFKRGHQIVELQSGSLGVDDVSKACAEENFPEPQDYETLVPDTSLRIHPCPGNGRYEAHTTRSQLSCQNPKTRLSSGCHSLHTLMVEQTCEQGILGDENSKIVQERYKCHGHWEEDGVSYIIASDKDDVTTCFILKKDGQLVKIANYLSSCSRTTLAQYNSFKAYNLTSLGRCLSSSSLPVSIASTGSFVIHLISLLVLHLYFVPRQSV